MKIYFTCPSNAPTGGAKVINEVASLCGEMGYGGLLIMPEQEAKLADFMDEPAPVISMEMVREVIRDGDVIVFGWHSLEEFDLLKTLPNVKKVFWQHGNLIPLGPGLAGPSMLDKTLLDQYWNVSNACGKEIIGRYDLGRYHLVQPFFSKSGNIQEVNLVRERPKTILVQDRRGVELHWMVRLVGALFGYSVRFLKAPFRVSELDAALSESQFFVSWDRGLSYRRSLRQLFWEYRQLNGSSHQKLRALVGERKWVKPTKNLLGFPISAAHAASRGCVVVGYAMGGGLEWMNSNNCFMARDGSAFSLAFQLVRALLKAPERLDAIALEACRDISRFSAEATWNQIRVALDLS